MQDDEVLTEAPGTASDSLQQLLETVMSARQDEILAFLTYDMDPFDIDMSALADRCSQLLQECDAHNLTVPAHMLMASAVILNMKAEQWFGNADEKAAAPAEDDCVFSVDDMATEADTGEIEDVADDTHIPLLSLPIKRMPKTRVTLDDLQTALDTAQLLHTQREERQEQRPQVPVTLSEEDIEQRMQRLFAVLRQRMGNTDRIHFNDILEREDVREKVEKFVHVLHLEGDEKVRCVQEEFLGDLIVRLLERDVEEDTNG